MTPFNKRTQRQNFEQKSTEITTGLLVWPAGARVLKPRKIRSGEGPRPRGPFFAAREDAHLSRSYPAAI